MTYFWDKEGKYSDWNIKDYKFWSTAISYRQHTLWAYIILYKREWVEKISELENEELNELKTIMKEMEEIMVKIPEFNPNRFNYLQLWNKWHNLHFHCIPRYKQVRKFAWRKWHDTTYWTVPKWMNKELDINIIKKVKEKFCNHIDNA